VTIAGSNPARPSSLRKIRFGRSNGADGKQLLTTRSLLLSRRFSVSLENGIQAFSSVNSLTVSPDNPEGEAFEQQGGWPAGRRGQAGNPPPSVELGGNESPAWQDYFFLAPNVRFTRTPDYEASARQPRQIASSEQGEPQAMPARQAVAQPAAAATSSAVSSPSLSATMKGRNSASEAARPPAATEP